MDRLDRMYIEKIEKNNTIKLVIFSICIILTLTASNYLQQHFSKENQKNSSNQNFYTNVELFDIDNYTKCIGETDPPSDGSLGLWLGDGNLDDNYPEFWAVHNNSPIGERMQTAKIGDTFKIKGHRFKIFNIMFVTNDSAFYEIQDRTMPKNSSYQSIQTCVFGTNYFKICIADKF